MVDAARDGAFYSREYNNRQLVPEHPEILARWADESAKARNTMTCHIGVRYGDMPGETMDIFPARMTGDGTCMMFIHGGYWRAMDKSSHAFLAPPWVGAGVSVALVNYDLCPRVSIDEIVRQMLRASRWLYLHCEDYGMDQDRLYVAGHSAGGHLTAMMMAAHWPVFDRDLPKDLFKGALAISGIYDMRPIRHVDFLQPDLRLDEVSAERLSPALIPPATRMPVATCVGGNESSEFHRQAAFLKERWRSAVAFEIPMPGTNHFTVLDALADRGSALFAGARRMMKLDR
ncbi:MAG: alpha/beta hydrolase [Burkholderiales bacterium]